ncbi:MAG: hypothetical protein GXY76_12435 [Chloroflexi bacterium]|nr:hypothetical protein [Chloroflexota bacterium]
MAKKSRALPVKWSQLALVVGLTLLVAYLVALFEVAIQGSQARARAEEAGAEVATLAAEGAALKEHLDYVQTDTYVEKMARQELKWSRPGEKVYMAIPDVTATPTPTAVPTTTPTPTGSPSLWQRLKGLLAEPPHTPEP